PLSFTERWQVVAYVRALQQQNIGLAGNERGALHIQVSTEQVLAAGSKADEWLSYSGSLDGRRYSLLTVLAPENVSQLQLRWVYQSYAGDPTIETTPLVVDGVIFITESPAGVVALDARSGMEIWRYSRSLPSDLPVCCGRYNRGLAILRNVLFWG